MTTKVMILIPYLSGKGGMETVLTALIQDYPVPEGWVLTYGLTQGIQEPAFLKTQWPAEFKLKKTTTFKPLRQVRGVMQTFKQLQQNQPDIVICMSTRLLKLAAIWQRLTHRRAKLISWLHFSLADNPAINQHSLHWAQGHLCISTGIQQQFIAAGISAAQTYLVFNPGPEQQPLQLPALTPQVHFAYIGRILWQGQKQLHILFETLAHLAGDWRLTVVGDGPDLVVAQAFFKRHGLSQKVTFLGWQAQPWSKLTAIDCLVLTSKYEGFPMVLLEAISRGIPVISSDCPTGPSDIITPANGRLYDLNDAAALGQLLQCFVAGTLTFESELVQQTSQQFNATAFFKRFSRALEQIQNS
ncbi:glycosyltransferase [Agrilactobacillus yilanensis]|uniref:Glycosyltransferase n=1 Tax=Agrilactobacillus yilanensis TaxID=2485997 RepID=A0ABW4J9Z6_9LACO|nr:glycosyltransferase [Agrilactobacillus yilanensis]